jgi:hypothetical protein
MIILDTFPNFYKTSNAIKWISFQDFFFFEGVIGVYQTGRPKVQRHIIRRVDVDGGIVCLQLSARLDGRPSSFYFDFMAFVSIVRITIAVNYVSRNLYNNTSPATNVVPVAADICE